MLWRYRPADNRTPKLHPIIGGLVWDQVYDNPACADDPDFVPVEPDAEPGREATPIVVEPQDDDTPAGPETPADSPDAETAPAAGTPGRSN